MGLLGNVVDGTLNYRKKQVQKKLGVGGYSGQDKHYRFLGKRIKKPLILRGISKTLAVAELCLIVPASLGVKGVKGVAKAVPSKKIVGATAGLGMTLGGMYLKQASGYNDAKRTANLSMQGARLGTRVARTLLPLVSSGVGLLGKLAKNGISATATGIQNSKKEAKEKSKPKSNRQYYKEMKKINPDITPEDFSDNKEEYRKEVDKKFENNAENKSPSTDTEVKDRESLATQQQQVENARPKNMSDFIDDLVEKEPETIFDLADIEKKKMLNPNIYIIPISDNKLDNTLNKLSDIVDVKKDFHKEVEFILSDIQQKN